jgi:DNA-binding NarL/FixJ family response regulator
MPPTDPRHPGGMGPQSAGGELILVADDDEFFRMALRTILLRTVEGAEVIETASLDEALERLAETGNVTLALFDLNMPGMESAASLRAVRECFPDVQVAVVSASRRRDDMLLALEAGAHGYIPKSLGVAELATAIKVVRSGTIYVPTFIADLSGTEGEPNRPLTTTNSPAPDTSAGSLPHLSPRQSQVMMLIAQGRSNKEIARDLGLGEGTVKVHVAALFRALEVTSRTAVAAAATRLLRSHES